MYFTVCVCVHFPITFLYFNEKIVPRNVKKISFFLIFKFKKNDNIENICSNTLTFNDS